MSATTRQGRVAIAVMAKAPEAGRAKTRLVPPLDPEGAAALSAAFLRDITENIALAARNAPIVGAVAYAPAGSEALFGRVIAKDMFLLLADGRVPMSPGIQGIGRSLLHAVSAMLAAGYTGACVVNADSPTLPTNLLHRTCEALLQPGDRLVLGPADDGGYYLLGVKTPHPHLFENIAWSTDRVAEQTLARARSLRLETIILPEWYDVDDRTALARLIDDLRSPAVGAYAAHATTACLEQLGIMAPTR